MLEGRRDFKKYPDNCETINKSLSPIPLSPFPPSWSEIIMRPYHILWPYIPACVFQTFWPIQARRDQHNRISTPLSSYRVACEVARHTAPASPAGIPGAIVEYYGTSASQEAPRALSCILKSSMPAFRPSRVPNFQATHCLCFALSSPIMRQK